MSDVGGEQESGEAMESERRLLVVSHTSREDAIDSAVQVVERLAEAGVVPVLERATREELERSRPGVLPDRVETFGEDCPIGSIEIAVVLGGDGTILRAAELVRGSSVPIIGVNLGHVGFLAESERDSIPTVFGRVLERDYEVEERLAIAVTVLKPGEEPVEAWALNEGAIEKADRERMIEVAIGVDGEPLESFGCDGVILATPTGSTAYSFSAGGPVVWPGVEALLAVPISAHALFARPIVVHPRSTIVVDILDRTDAQAVLWCDGRRMIAVPPGSRVVAARSSEPVRLARLHEGPFTRRLVEKFQLPITGWRGPADKGRIEAQAAQSRPDTAGSGERGSAR